MPVCVCMYYYYNSTLCDCMCGCGRKGVRVAKLTLCNSWHLVNGNRCVKQWFTCFVCIFVNRPMLHTQLKYMWEVAALLLM